MIGQRAGDECRIHRSALLDFAARRAHGPAVGRALDHVERCRACEEELALTILVVHALRRLHDETWRVQPSPDGWARLRARLAAPRARPSPLLSGLPGIVLAAGLSAVLLGSGAILGDGRPELLHDASPDLPQLHWVLEARLDRARAATLLIGDETLRRHHRPAVASPRVTALRPSSAGRRPEPVEEVEAPPGAAMLAGGPAERHPGRR